MTIEKIKLIKYLFKFNNIGGFNWTRHFFRDKIRINIVIASKEMFGKNLSMYLHYTYHESMLRSDIETSGGHIVITWLVVTLMFQEQKDSSEGKP